MEIPKSLLSRTSFKLGFVNRIMLSIILLPIISIERRFFKIRDLTLLVFYYSLSVCVNGTS